MSLVWVTGAAGFIGRHLVRSLASEEGARVAGLDLVGASAAGLADCAAAWQEGKVSGETLAALAEETGTPDTIFHLAGGSSVGASLADPRGDLAATVEGTGALLEWLRTNAPDTRLLIVSSAAVYGNLHAGPIEEGAATSPFSPYGAHKFAAESICRGWAGSFGLNIVAARLFSVYGPWLSKQLLWDLSGKLRSGASTVTLGGTGGELRDWTHVDDVVRAMADIAGLASPEMPIVNVGTGVPVSVGAISQRLAKAHGRDPDCLRFSGESRPGDPFSLVAAPGLLDGRGFQWRVTLEEGLRGYADWYQSRANA